MQDIWRVGPEVGTEEIGHRGLCNLFEVGLKICLGIAPSEVGIRLCVSRLAQPIHNVWPGKRLGEIDGVRIFRPQRTEAPFPERHGLGAVSYTHPEPTRRTPISYAVFC